MLNQNGARESWSVFHLIKSVMAGLSGETDESADGPEMLAAYNCHRPDFVVMGIQIGPLDGITATRLVKAADPAARIIIVRIVDSTGLERTDVATPTWG